MNQSNIIAGVLLIAFVVFITMRGELQTYLGFFFGGGPAPQASGSPKSTAAAPAPQQQSSNASGLGSLALEALPFILA